MYEQVVAVVCENSRGRLDRLSPNSRRPCLVGDCGPSEFYHDQDDDPIFTPYEARIVISVTRVGVGQLRNSEMSVAFAIPSSKGKWLRMLDDRRWLRALKFQDSTGSPFLTE